MKGIIITKIIIVIIILAIAAYFLLGQGQLPSISGPIFKQTTIKSTEEASSKIIDIGTSVENVESTLEDIDNILK